VIDPVAEQKIVDQDISDLPTIVISSSEIWDHERICSEFACPIQQFPLLAALESSKRNDRRIRENRPATHLSSALAAPQAVRWS